MIRTATLAACLLYVLPALAAGERFEESREIDADGSVQVENLRGLIRVSAWDRPDIGIQGTLGEGAKGLLVEGDRRRLSIRIDYPNGQDGRGWFGWFGGGAVGDSELLVNLPPGVSLAVRSVAARVEVNDIAGARAEISSVSGDLAYRGSAALLEIETVSGDARIEGRARELQLQSVSGDVSVEADVVERLRAESVSGDLQLRSSLPIRQLQANVVSGDVTVRVALAADGRLSAQSLSGDVEVMLPKATSARLGASSFSGRIHSDVGTVKKEEYGPGSSLEATLGDGAGKIQLESFSGDLTLRLE